MSYPKIYNIHLNCYFPVFMFYKITELILNCRGFFTSFAYFLSWHKKLLTILKNTVNVTKGDLRHYITNCHYFFLAFCFLELTVLALINHHYV